jgi:hypothetical protein
MITLNFEPAVYNYRVASGLGILKFCEKSAGIIEKKPGKTCWS